MPIRKHAVASESKDAIWTRRALADAIVSQRRRIKEAEDFDKNEETLRIEYAYLAWLEKLQRYDGDKLCFAIGDRIKL